MIEHFAGGPIRHILPWGAFGVQPFFALSGFLITSLLLEARRRMDEGGGLAQAVHKFLAGRTLRIFPVYYLTLALTALLGVQEIRAHFPWFFFYSSNFLFAREEMWRGPGSHFWSLAVEEQFYLFWPWVILLSPRRLLGRLVCGMIAIGPVSRLIVHAMGLSDVAVLVLPMCNLDVLGMGALLAVVREDEGERLARWGLRVGAPISLVLLVLHARHMAPTVVVVMLSLALSAVWLAVIRWAVSEGDGVIRRAITAAPLTYLGRISYGVYVYHLFMPLLLSEFVPYVLPVCFLLAVVSTYGRLEADGEWTAIQMSGMQHSPNLLALAESSCLRHMCQQLRRHLELLPVCHPNFLA